MSNEQQKVEPDESRDELDAVASPAEEQAAAAATGSDGAPSDGAPSDGAPSDGAPSDGAEGSAAEDAAEAAADAAEAAGDISSAEATVEQLQQELADAREAALRAHAEAQNARRRSEQDVEKARKYALERFASDLLPVVDNLERALEAAGESAEAGALTEGVDLTLRSMLDVLGKFGVEQVDPAGEPFDPQVHQAMTMVPNPDLEPNTVMDVMQKGFTLNGRLLRPAMVVVSKSPD